MKSTRRCVISAFVCMFLVPFSDDCRAESRELVQYGSMHETIGKKNHQARVDIADLLKKPHFYAVGAVEGLQGEITILDSKAIVTAAKGGIKPETQSSSGARATLLVGQSVPAWTEVACKKDIAPGEIDGTIGEMAAANGIEISSPFMFVIEGEFTSVRLHVINGVCPIRARMKKEEIADEHKPFEFESKRVKGTLVGIFAANAVGKLTHPATTQHSHLIYIEPSSGEHVTGHLEQFGVVRGAVLKLSRISEPDAAHEPPPAAAGTYPET